MNRRTLVFGAGAVAALALLGRAGDAAAQGQTFSRIIVDTRLLEARGAHGAASVIRPHLQASLQRAFAGRIGRGGPVLTVRVHSVLLSSSLGTGGRRGSGPASDYLEAEVTAGGRSFPLLVTQDVVSAGGAWYLPDNEVRRLRALADSLAHWTARRA